MDTIEKAREICRKLKLPEDGPARVIIADEIEYLNGQLQAAEQELVIAFGTIRQLQAQLAETPDEQREMAESAWLAGMDDTWYAKLQAAEQRAAEAERIIVRISGIISEAWGDYDGGNLPNGIQEIFDVLAERDQAAAAWLEAGEGKE